MSDDFAGTHSSEFEVDLKDLSGSQTDQALADIRRTLQWFSGAAFSVNTFLTERINEILSGYTGAVVVNIYGPDLNELRWRGGALTQFKSWMFCKQLSPGMWLVKSTKATTSFRFR